MYELLYIVPAIHTEEELKNVINKTEAVIKEQGVEVQETKNLGKLKFAYKIGKQTSGHYILVEFSAEPDVLKKLNRALQLEPEVLRFMVTKKIKGTKEFKMAEFTEVDPSKKRKEKREPSVAKQVKEKEKIKLEDIEKKLDTLLEKEIV